VRAREDHGRDVAFDTGRGGKQSRRAHAAGGPPGPGSAPRDTGAPAQTASIPVAASPEGLLAPGAEAQIRDKLASGGYLDKNDEDASLQTGLRKFQKARDLPQTGIPNHETVQALGLDPGLIFKHADVGK
jgi:hypothetical protein